MSLLFVFPYPNINRIITQRLPVDKIAHVRRM